MKKSDDALIFVQLNEINFDIVQKYLSKHDLPAFKHIMLEFERYETFAEQDYKNLEPWIQWVSIHTGKTYSEHGVFRLGDIVNTKPKQIFEILEERGLKVGAISPMNAHNAMKNPAFFMPDPWTDTPSDDSKFSQRFTAMIRQTVNENATGTISVRSTATIFEAVIRSFSFSKSKKLFQLIKDSLSKPWLKSLVLDQIIHLTHLKLLKRTQPDVSFIFLNAGAHIQHHYLLNSPFSGSANKNPKWYVPENSDPILDMLKIYDGIIGDYLLLGDQGKDLIIATGLTQTAYDRVKYYYRLRNHELFLKEIDIEYDHVLPRMTRDFEICFSDRRSAIDAKNKLFSIKMKSNKIQIFSDIEDRGNSLFVTLTYPDEISKFDMAIMNSDKEIEIFKYVAFVAIKNGMHSSNGYLFASRNSRQKNIESRFHVSKIFDIVLERSNRG